MAKVQSTQGSGEPSDVDPDGEVGLEHVVAELRMLRTEMEGYYSNLFQIQEMMLNSWGDFFALWMETVKRDHR